MPDWTEQYRRCFSSMGNKARTSDRVDRAIEITSVGLTFLKENRYRADILGRYRRLFKIKQLCKLSILLRIIFFHCTLPQCRISFQICLCNNNSLYRVFSLWHAFQALLWVLARYFIL